MADISIFNATIVTMDRSRRIINDGALIIRGDRINGVGESQDIRARYGEVGKVIDGAGMVAVPGLINAHTHTSQILLRGMGDDMGPLLNWSNSLLMPSDSALDDEVVYVSALLSCLEMIKSGTTFFIDHVCQNTGEGAIDKIAQAIKETGIKGLIARGMLAKTARLAKMRPDKEYPSVDEEVSLTEKIIHKWHGKSGGRISVCPGPVIASFVEDDIMLEAKRLSDKYQVPIHSHIAEVTDEVRASLEDHGKREIERLCDLGVLGPELQAVHGVWLDDREVKLFGKARANLIHCPISNMYLASGVAPVPQLLKAGANIALGTDVSCNENNDMIQTMKTAVLLHKVHTLDPKVTPAGQILEMATLGGSRALALEDEIGSIVPGKKADIILINLSKPHIVPSHRIVPALVYCANGADVENVIIDGEIVMENREVKTVDEEKVIETAMEMGCRLVENAKMTSLRDRPQFI